MDTAIRVGGNVDEKSAMAVAKAITTVLDSAFKNHMEQETTREAIKAVVASLAPNNTTITNSVFGDKSM